ncbi:MAG TPA: T9SS type A sorting domain-containing protein [Chitinophagaceae bacterium]
MLQPQIKNMLLIACMAAAMHAGAQEVLRVQNGGNLLVESGVELTVYGDVMLLNGSTLTNHGTIRTRRNGAGTANWADATVAPYNHGTGRFIFNSTATQTITSNNIFERIDMDGAGLNLASNISANKWYLITGPIATNGFTAIALSTAQLAVEADPANTLFVNSWVNGTLRRFVSPSTVNVYTFPVGGASRANIAGLDNLNAQPLNNLTYIDASFGPKPGTDAGLIVTENGTPYLSVNSGGVWYLVPDAAPSSGRFDLLLRFNGFTGLQDNRFAILIRPVASSNAADWAVPSGSSLNPNGGAGRMVADGYSRRNNIASLAQFGIGEMSAALPVTLVDFTANRLTALKVKLQWETATEQNNKGFEIERRLENENTFVTLGFIGSKAMDGNSSGRLQYNMVDPNGYGGISYYRLKQLDRDGRSAYSLIKAVKGTGETSVSVLLWPNPAKGQFSIRADGINGTKEAFIANASGQIIRSMRLGNSEQVNVQGLPAGNYVLTVMHAFGQGEHFVEKIVVVR